MPVEAHQERVAAAAVHHQAGRLAEAEGLYRQVLAEAPDDPRALHGLGGIALHVGRHEAAMELVKRAIDIDPQEANYHGALGVIHFSQRCWPEAVGAFARAVELKPGMYQWNIHLADSLRMQGDVDGAAAVFIRTIDLLPEVPEAHFHIGTMLLQLGKMDEAKRCAAKAVLLRPEYAEAHNTLGLALLQTGQADDAVVEFRRVVQLRPRDPAALNNLASVLGVIGRTGEVIEILRQALAIQPDNATARPTAGLVWSLESTVPK